MRSPLFASLLATLCLACASCSSSSSSPTNAAIVGGDGVDDVAKACEIRAGWANNDASTCARCEGLVMAPRCVCADSSADEDYAGACSAQVAALNADASCSNAVTCENTCKQGDCACVDTCYAGMDMCRSLASAVDGCVAEQCTPDCK
jgi:hypothetical protein